MAAAALGETERKQMIDRFHSAMTTVVCDTVTNELGPRAPGAAERTVCGVAVLVWCGISRLKLYRELRELHDDMQRHPTNYGVKGTAQQRAVGLMKQIFELEGCPGGTPSYMLRVAQFVAPKKCQAICYTVCGHLASMLQDEKEMRTVIELQETPALSATDRERAIAKLRSALRQLVCDALAEEAARHTKGGAPAASDGTAAKMHFLRGIAGLKIYGELSTLYHDAEMCPTSYGLGDRGACDLSRMLILDKCPDGTWTVAPCWSFVAHAVPFETCQRVCDELCVHLQWMLADQKAMAQLVAAEGHPAVPQGGATVRRI